MIVPLIDRTTAAAVTAAVTAAPARAGFGPTPAVAVTDERHWHDRRAVIGVAGGTPAGGAGFGRRLRQWWRAHRVRSQWGPSGADDGGCLAGDGLR